MSAELKWYPKTPPRGWRWLKDDETIRKGDLYHSSLPQSVVNEAISTLCDGELRPRRQAGAPVVDAITGAIGQYIRRR